MKIEVQENAVLLTDEKDDVKDFSEYLANQGYRHLKGKNVIVNLMDYGSLKLEELLQFLNLSNQHRNTGHSFVIINDTINIDRVPHELMVVPTLREAKDVITMEEIERDLGAF